MRRCFAFLHNERSGYFTGYARMAGGSSFVRKAVRYATERGVLRLSDLALAGKRKAQSEQSVIVLKLLACPIPHADQSRSHCLTQVVEEDAIDD